jgi:DNA-directed RNA polymerase
MHTIYEQNINTNEVIMEIDAKILEKFNILKKNENVPSTLHEKIEAEKQLELAMIKSGIKRFHKTINKARAKVKEKDGKQRETTESTTVYGQVLIQSGLEPMNKAINKYFIEAFDGHAKRYATEATLLAKCLPIKEVQNDNDERWASLSFISLKAVLDSITVSSTQTKAVLKIAGAVEDEARLLYFRESDNKTYSQTKEWLKTKNNYRHKRKVFQYAMNKHQLEYAGWSKEEKVKLGKLLLELLASTTGFVKLTRTYTLKNKSIVYVQATDKTMEWIEQKKIHAEILKPFREPMLVKPKTWDENPYSGGYYIKDLRPKELSATVGELHNQNQQSNNEVKDAL